MKQSLITLLFLALMRLPHSEATDPWPGEPHTRALNLTGLDAGFHHDISGASWNPATRTFWVCCNSPGIFWALVEDGSNGWRVATDPAGKLARWNAGGDLEGICQTDFTKPSVLLLDENGWIRQFDISQFAKVNQLTAWDIRAYCPEIAGDGPEAITFVPNHWLNQRGFKDARGQPCVATNGMGGLIFIGSQMAGMIHVFDLKPNSTTFTYVGSNRTSRTETAGLEFDRDHGLLHIWHNTGPNYLEITDLTSTLENGIRRFRTFAEFTGPRPGNLEGYAYAPLSPTNGWALITDDSNSNGEAILLYRHVHVPGRLDLPK
jgi:hypothetical protein